METIFPIHCILAETEKITREPLQRRFAENDFADLVFMRLNLRANLPDLQRSKLHSESWSGIVQAEHQASRAAAASFFSFSSISGFVH